MMRHLRAALARIAGMFTRDQAEDDLRAELQSHLEMETAENIQRGMEPREARRQALLAAGGVTQAAEAVRDRRGIPWLENLIRDFAVGIRGLGRRPGFAITVALTLGLGIGATTAVYTVVDAVLVRPLPYSDPGGLVTVGSISSTDEWLDGSGGLQVLRPMSMPDFLYMRERARSFEETAAIERIEYPLVDVGAGPEMIAAARVTDGMFAMIGVSPAVGRTFLAEEFSVSAPPVVMLSYGAWQRQYGGDLNVIGRPLDRSASPTTIVGVLPHDFVPPEAYFRADEVPEFWFPLAGDDNRYQRRTGGNLLALGRLRPGATLEGARIELGSIADDLEREYPTGVARADGSRPGIGANALHAATVGTTGRTLLLFLGAAGLLLGLASLNAATLFFARTVERSNELGTRAALGASRARVVSLLAGEATVLCGLGGLVGLAIAYQAIAVFRAFAPETIPRVASIAVDIRVLVVAAAVSLGAGIVAGLFPALRFTRRGEWERLQAVSRSPGSGRPSFPRVMVGGQAAAAVVSLACAALLFGSFVRVRSVDPGFDADGLLSMRLDIEGFARSSPDRFTSAWAAWDLGLQELAAVPGVDAVAATSDVPYRSPSWSPRLLLPGDRTDTWREGIAGYAITPEYLRTMGTELLGGRGLEAADGPDSERVALVNESFVRTQLDGADPLGVVLQSTDGPEPVSIRIVGVVEDVVQARPEDGPRPAVYVPYSQVARQPFVVVRTTRAPQSIVPELRRAVARFNPIVPPREVTTMIDRMAVTRATPRFQALLIGAFALVSVLIAAAGLYSALAQAVGRRRRELAVRMALGADRSSVHRMVIRQGMTVSMSGLAIGMLVALLVGRTLSGTLYDLEPHDPLTLAAVAVTFLLVSLIACLGPARRATSVHPATVLRGD